MRSAFWMMIMLGVMACRRNDVTLTPISGSTGVGGVSSPNTWLALGDSYTIGQGVKEEERFPAQTVERLGKLYRTIDTLRYIAVTGWTTVDLLTAIGRENPRQHKVVSLLIGVNDQYRGWDSAAYRIRFRDALQQAVRLAGGKPSHVFVLSIPDYGVTAYARHLDTARIRREIDGYNRINREISSSMGCPYLDITGLTREARWNRQLICGDSLHPSGIDYGRWADRLAPMMEGLLQ
jgi:lysophospholipase L1-like esterase